jgi:hypothetical protein
VGPPSASNQIQGAARERRAAGHRVQPGRDCILDRKSLEKIGSFGSRGAAPGQFQNLHSIAIDSKGTIYGPEVAPGRRLQRFVYKGMK